MTKKEKKALYTCNVGDFVRNFKDKKYLGENGANVQFGDSLTYLAKYNMQGSTKECDFFDLVYATKKSLIKQATERKIDPKKNSYYQQMGKDYGDNFDSVKAFIFDPIDFLQESFKEYANGNEVDEELDPDKREFNSRLKENARDLSKTLQTQARRYQQYEASAKAKDLEYSILSKLPGKAIDLDDVFEKTKGGFLERAFGRTSQDSRNLKTAFNEYRNPNSVHHGDDRHVEIEAIKYLQHVIPAYRDDSELPTKAQLEALTGTQKARADFCVSVIESVRERREQEEATNDLMELIKNDFAVEEESVIDEEQNEFHQQVQNDLGDLAENVQENVNDNNNLEAQKEIEEPNVK